MIELHCIIVTKKRSRRALAQRRALGLQSVESRRDLFPDLEPSDDNFALYQSFLEKYKLGMILNETMRLKYYNTLFPAMDTMRNTLSDNHGALDENIDESTQVVKDESSAQVLASSISNNFTKNDEEEDAEYEYDDDDDDSGEEEEEEEQEIQSSISDDDEDDDDNSGEYEYEYEYEYETDDEFDDDDAQNDKNNQK